jgi:hypothetical protein
MRKFLYGSLLCLIFISSANSKTFQNHTFLASRPQGVNLPLQMSSWHHHLDRNENEKRSHFQKTFFHSAAIKGADLGKYFGVGNGKNYFTVGAENTDDIVNNYLVHKYDYANTANTAAGTITFNPKQEVYGLRLDFLTYFNHPLKKMFLKASAPIVHVENDLHVKFENLDENNYLDDFFRGSLTQENENAQDALTNAKFSGRRSSSGVADIDLALGYRFFENDKHHLYLNAGITIPTGTRPDGEWLFEAVYGNGHHFGVGFGIDGALELWSGLHNAGKLLFDLQYRYLIEGTEKRIIPLKNDPGKFTHYYLAGKVDQAAGTALFPMANVLAQEFSVRPGNQLDAMLALSIKRDRFIIDLGYNMFYKQAESLRLKTEWEDDTYGIANTNLNVSTLGEQTIFRTNEATKTINSTDLNIPGAGTPQQFTHKAFGSIGYNFTISELPSTIAFGGSYEFASSNHELEGYAFWVKGGISF